MKKNRSKKIKYYRLTSYISVIVWLSLGLLTLGSILNGTIGYFINSIMGVIFILIAYYLFARAKNMAKILTHSCFLKTENQRDSKLFSQFLFLEIIFVAISFIIGIVFLSGAISRVFGEGFPLFG